MSISGRVKGYGAGGEGPIRLRCWADVRAWRSPRERSVRGEARNAVRWLLRGLCVCVLSSAAACRRFRQICSLFRWMFQWNSMLRPELHQIPPLICYFLPVRLRWAMGSVRWVDLPAELWLIGAKMNVSAEQRVLDELYWAKGKFSVLIVLLLLIRNFWIFLYDIGNCYR